MWERNIVVFFIWVRICQVLKTVSCHPRLSLKGVITCRVSRSERKSERVCCSCAKYPLWKRPIQAKKECILLREKPHLAVHRQFKVHADQIVAYFHHRIVVQTKRCNVKYIADPNWISATHRQFQEKSWMDMAARKSTLPVIIDKSRGVAIVENYCYNQQIRSLLPLFPNNWISVIKSRRSSLPNHWRRERFHAAIDIQSDTLKLFVFFSLRSLVAWRERWSKGSCCWAWKRICEIFAWDTHSQ